MGKEAPNFTEKELKIVYFFISRKKFFKKILIFSLVLINILIYSYLIYHFSWYLTQNKEYKEMEKELSRSLVEYQEIRKIISPLPLEIISGKAISIGHQKYNLVCLIRNPNKTWFVESLTYKFSSFNFETKPLQTFVLPEEEKIIVDFNETINYPPKDVLCQVEKIKWRRIKPKNYHLLEIPKNFIIRDLKHIPARKPNEKSITTFKFINSTVYNFWEINLLVAAYEGREIVDVERTLLKEILSGEEREIKIIWPNLLTFFPEIKVQPEINVFDQSLFFPHKIKPEDKL